MIAFIQKIFIMIFGTNSALATFFIALVPVVEVKGAIPFGMNKGVWGKHALSLFEAAFFAYLGSVFVTILLLLIFEFLYKKIKDKNFMQSFNNKLAKITSKSDGDKFIFLMIFTALPVPLTGVFTGSAIASLSGMPFYKKFLAISLGNLICTAIITASCYFFGQNSMNIFWIFLISLFIIAFIYLLKIIFSKPTNFETKRT